MCTPAKIATAKVSNWVLFYRGKVNWISGQCHTLGPTTMDGSNGSGRPPKNSLISFALMLQLVDERTNEATTEKREESFLIPKPCLNFFLVSTIIVNKKVYLGWDEMKAALDGSFRTTILR